MLPPDEEIGPRIVKSSFIESQRDTIALIDEKLTIDKLTKSGNDYEM